MEKLKSFVTANGQVKTESAETFSHPLRVKATTKPNDKPINRVDLVSKKNNQTFDLKKVTPLNSPDWNNNKFEGAMSKVKNVDPSNVDIFAEKINFVHISVFILSCLFIISGFVLAFLAKIYNLFK